MPAPINTNVHNVATSANKSDTRAQSKKTRVTRRRGRGKDALDSDEEIEREINTDSETDESSYVSDSESESASDDEAHNGIVTPSTQSPPPLDIGGPSTSMKPTDLVNGSSGPFVTPTNWAQLVADEDTNGTADLPVIDFADMHNQILVEPKSAPPSRSRKAQKQDKKPLVATAVAPELPAEVEVQSEATEAVPPPAEETVASSSGGASQELDNRKPRGQSARQAYQQRLQDPAFVPRVGEFWGHDDRLLDKDLRSLSGWWRGRWQHRGRGRGTFTMRGRGGHVPANGPPSRADQQTDESLVVPENVPPVDRAWTHDGFEEMKRKEAVREDQRRLQDQQQPQTFGAYRGARGRGGFFGGRGRGFARGGGVAANMGASFTATNVQDPSTQRVWFAMKPEKVWTKHTDTYLYLEHVPRARPNQAMGIRIRLPGGAGQVVANRKQTHLRASTSQTDAASTSTAQDEEDRQFVVRIPRPPPLEAEPVPQSQPVAETAEVTTTMEELSIEEVFTVRPHAVPSHVPITTPTTQKTELAESVASSSALPNGAETSNVPLPSDIHDGPQATAIQAPVEVMQPEAPQFQASVPEVIAPVPQVPEGRPLPPMLPPLQTTFSPVPQTSPQYGSPYAYAPALPPGIAMTHQGYPYDMATGRPVYLQTPPPSMYTPRPMMPGYMPPPSSGMPFVPGHMHHPSQEYVPQTHTPPINGFVDPSTGVPIFTPARQSSRIEIRAPDGTSMKPAPRPSGLRTSMSGLESLDMPNGESEQQTNVQQQQPMAQMDPAMMGYAPYQQQQYYYPDPNGYPGAYMDMSQQMMPQYEMYPPPQPDPQPVIYY